MTTEQNQNQNQNPQNSLDESFIFEMDPLDIKVREDAPRYRKDLGDIKNLVESIKNFGQLQPIVISRNNELIYGGRRLAACIVGNFKAKVCYRDTADKTLMRELELEENLQRKDFSPSEQALAIQEIHLLKQSIYGESTSGKKGVGWSLDKTAELINKSVSSVVESIHIAEMVKEFPELSKAKTSSEIRKAYKGLERIQQGLIALSSYEDQIKTAEEFSIVNSDATDFMKEVSTASVDLLFTDPPYGISVHDNTIGIGGHTDGTFTTAGFKYDDSEENAKALLTLLSVESYRFTKHTGQAYIFCAPSYFWWLKDTMITAGWLVRERPIVWIKRETGQNNQPEKWPSSAYEFILFARKPDAKLILQGRPDWVQCDIVLSSVRIHQAEKPVPLLKELVARTSEPGQVLIDPFCGSGAIIEAACDMKLLASGCELSIEAYAGAVRRMKEWKERNK